MRGDDALDNNPRVSRAALAALHEELYGWAYSRCRPDRMAAEDLLQEAYVELLSGRARFDGHSSLKSFMFGVIENLSRSRFRRLMRQLRLRLQHAPAIEPAAEPNNPEPGQGKAVRDALFSLPMRQRDITELVFFRELTIEEASAVMGVSVGSGRQHYARAKQALAGKLAAFGPATDDETRL